MDQEKKEKYKELIDQTKTKEAFKEIVKMFVDSYDGTNTAETEMLVASIIQHLLDDEVLLVKSEAYDQVSRVKEAQADRLEEITETAVAVKTGEEPLIPSTNFGESVSEPAEDISEEN